MHSIMLNNNDLMRLGKIKYENLIGMIGREQKKKGPQALTLYWYHGMS